MVSKILRQESSELHLLKSFLVLSVENMKLKVNELLNEKEDMTAIHQSDSEVKEHLIERINEQEKSNMEKSTELMFSKRRVQELVQDRVEVEDVKMLAVRDLNEVRQKLLKDIKILKDRVVKL